MLKNTDDTYGDVSRALHWSIAAMIIGLLASGLYMTGLERADPARPTFYQLHKAFGIVVLFLGAVRIIWTIYSRPPAPLTALQRWEVLSAKATAGIFYFLMLAIPMSGWAMSNLKGHPVSVFGLFNMPVLAAKNEGLGDIASLGHEWLSYLAIALLVAHVAGALKHRFMDGAEADVLRRML